MWGRLLLSIYYSIYYITIYFLYGVYIKRHSQFDDVAITYKYLSYF